MTIARPPQPSRAKANNAASPASSAATSCQPGTARGDRSDEDGAGLTSPAAMNLARFPVVARKMRSAPLRSIVVAHTSAGAFAPLRDDARCRQVRTFTVMIEDGEDLDRPAMCADRVRHHRRELCSLTGFDEDGPLGEL